MRTHESSCHCWSATGEMTRRGRQSTWTGMEWWRRGGGELDSGYRGACSVMAAAPERRRRGPGQMKEESESRRKAAHARSSLHLISRTQFWSSSATAKTRADDITSKMFEGGKNAIWAFYLFFKMKKVCSSPSTAQKSAWRKRFDLWGKTRLLFAH